MWLKSGSWTGLGTDAWIFNYGVGIGSTQVPYGVRLAAGGMQVTDTTLSIPKLSISDVSTFNNTLNVVPTATSIAGLFSGTTSSDMVRITQLGSGNALVVEDSANPDATPFVVNASGSVGIGTTNPSSTLTVVGGASISGLTTTNNLSVSGVGTFLSSGLKIRNPANTFQYNITGSAILADRILNLPVITATDTVATLGLSQTFSAAQTFSSILSASGTLDITGSPAGTHVFGSNQTSGTLTFGGSSGTGLITFGRATTSQQTDIQAGITASGNTKIINFGTSGASGSFTRINIGPTAGVGTVVINSGTNLLVGTTTATGTASQPLQVNGGAYVSGSVGIGTTNPTSTLTVVGNGLFSGTGIVTATTFIGGLTGIASTATTALGFSTTASINTSGIVTASSFVGSLTGTATTANNVSPDININTTGIITATKLVTTNDDIYVRESIRIGNGDASQGEHNLVFGENALLNYFGSGFFPKNNIAFGYNSLRSQTSGSENLSIGNDALYTNDGGEYNLAIGNNALRSNLSGTNNLSIGWNALYNSTGSNNLAIGRAALNGGGNISNNIAIGAYAGNGITGSANIIMGINIALDSASGSNNVAIGTDVPNLAASNQLAIGNYSGAWIYGNSSYNVGLGTSTPTSKLHVVGDGRFTGIITASQLDLSANATANDSVLYLSGTPTSASGTNGLLGVGALSFSDTDIIANFTHNVNGYAQVVVQNKNSGASSSADIIVNNDRSAGTTYYGDFGINGTTFSAGGVFGDVDGTYLYAAGGTLSLGSLNDYAVKIATNNTERVRINATGVGIGTTNPTTTLQVQGSTIITGITSIRDVTIDKSIASPNATVPVAIIGVTTSGISTETNIDVVLLAKGTGATLAQVPDGTIAGGNKRGIYATDWQKSRAIATQVASSYYSTIGGGYANVCSSGYSVVAGGDSNTASTNEYATIGGGSGNQCSGNFGTISGGQSNNVSNTRAAISGGFANTASATNAVVCGGQSNTASGTNSFVGGGNGNTASGSRAAVSAGFTNNASATSATIAGGDNNIANGQGSFVSGGYRGTARGIQGYHVFPACNEPIAAASGVTQSALLLLGRQTTDATATVLTSNSSAAATTNQVTLPNNSAYFFKGSCIAGVTGAGDTKAWEFRGAIKRGANAAATSIVGSVIKDVIASDAGASTWDITITADTTNGAIAVTVTGAASTTIRWVCKIETTEMTY